MRQRELLFLLVLFATVAFINALKCAKTNIDACCVIDGSGGVSLADYLLFVQTCRKVGEELSIGGIHRLAVIAFGPTAQVLLGLTASTSTQDFVNKMNAITAKPGFAGTSANTAAGIDSCRTELTNNGQAGSSRTMLIMTLTTSSNPAAAATSANAARGEGVRVHHSSGVAAVSLTDAMAIADSPFADCSIRCVDMTEWREDEDSLVTNMVKKLCPGDLGGFCNKDKTCDKDPNLQCDLKTRCCECKPGFLDRDNDGMCDPCVLGGMCVKGCCPDKARCKRQPNRKEICECKEPYVNSNGECRIPPNDPGSIINFITDNGQRFNLQSFVFLFIHSVMDIRLHRSVLIPPPIPPTYRRFFPG